MPLVKYLKLPFFVMSMKQIVVITSMMNEPIVFNFHEIEQYNEQYASNYVMIKYYIKHVFFNMMPS